MRSTTRGYGPRKVTNMSSTKKEMALKGQLRVLNRAQEVLCENTEDKLVPGDVLGQAVHTEFARLERARRVVLARLKELVERASCPKRGRPLRHNPFLGLND